MAKSVNNNLITETIKTLVPADPATASNEQFNDARTYESKQNVFIENTSAQSDTHKGAEIDFKPSVYVPAGAPTQKTEAIEKQVASEITPEAALPSTKTVHQQGGSEEVHIIEGAKSTTKGGDSFTTITKELTPLTIPHPEAKAIELAEGKPVEFSTHAAPSAPAPQASNAATATSQIVTSSEVLIATQDQTIPENSPFSLSLGFKFLAQSPTDTFTPTEYVISGLPSGANQAVTLFYNGSPITSTTPSTTTPYFSGGEYFIPAALIDQISAQPHAQDNQPLTFSASVVGHSSSNPTLLISSAPAATHITITPVASTPTIGGVSNLSDFEGHNISLGAITTSSPGQIGGVDAPYGTEVLTGIISASSLPANSFLIYNGNPTPLPTNTNGDYVVDISKLSQLLIEAPAHYKGSFDVQLTVTSTEPLNNDSASAITIIPVTVNPVANGFASEFSATISGVENSGPDVSDPSAAHAIVLVLNDPSETVHVILNNVPTGAIFTATTNGVTSNFVGTGGTQDISGWGQIITVAGQTEWVLDSLQYSPTLNSSANPGITLSTYTTDGSSTSPVQTVSIPIDIQAIAQTPSLNLINGSSFTMSEDPAGINVVSNLEGLASPSAQAVILQGLGANTNIPLIHFQSVLPPGDSGDSLLVTVSGIPAGTILAQYDSTGTILETYTYTSGTLALQNPSSLGGDYYLKVIPSSFASGTFDLTINSVSTAQGSNIAPGHLTASASTQTIEVTVNAVADSATLSVVPQGAPSLAGFIAISENSPEVFQVHASVKDSGTTDYTAAGPEHITSVTISGLSNVLSLLDVTTNTTYTPAGADSITIDTSGQNITSFNDVFSFQPNTNFTGSINPTVAITTTEPSNSSTHITTTGFQTIVENPNIVLTPLETSIPENFPGSPPNSFSFNIDAMVPGEKVSFIVISNLPPGSTISDSGGFMVTQTVGNSGFISFNFNISPTEYKDTFTITPPDYYNGPLSPNVSAFMNTGDQISGNFTVDVAGQANPAEISISSGGTYSVNENPLSSYGNLSLIPHVSATISANAFSISETNNNESFTVTISGLPPGSSILNPADLNSTPISDNGTGTVTLTEANFPGLTALESAGAATLNFDVIPPANYTTSGVPVNVIVHSSLNSTVADSNTAAFNLVVNPVNSSESPPLISNLSISTPDQNHVYSNISFVSDSNISSNQVDLFIESVQLQGIPNGFQVFASSDTQFSNPLPIVGGVADLTSLTNLSLGGQFGTTSFILVPTLDQSTSGILLSLIDTTVTGMSISVTSTGSSSLGPLITENTTLPFNFYIDPPPPTEQTSLTGNLDALASLAVPGSHAIDLLDYFPNIHPTDVIAINGLDPGSSFYNFAADGSLTKIATANVAGFTLLEGYQLNELYATFPQGSGIVHFTTDSLSSTGTDVHTQFAFDLSNNHLYQDTASGWIDLSSHTTTNMAMDTLSVAHAAPTNFEINDLGFVQPVAHDHHHDSTGSNPHDQHHDHEQHQIPTDTPTQVHSHADQIGMTMDHHHHQ